LHTITLKISDEAYPQLQYLIQNLPDVNIIEDIEIESIYTNEKYSKNYLKI